MAGVVAKVVGKRMLKDNKYFKVCSHLCDTLALLDIDSRVVGSILRGSTNQG
jgi:hypothetical protein